MKFQIPNSNILLTINIKLKANSRFHVAAMFYILQKN
jgi:hypothetical protein